MQQSEAKLRSLNLDLSASESKYRGIVDHAPFGIFTAKDGRIIFCNRHNWILAGRNPDEQLEPESIWEAIHPDDRDQVYSSFSDATTQQVPFENVFRFVHPDGTTHKILSRAIPIQDGHGSDSLYQGFNVDITAFEQMREKLSRTERLATLGQMAAGIAHEIRNPLVGIGSTTALLMEEFPPDDTKRDDLITILKETRRLDRIVTQIVEYAKPRNLVAMSFEIAVLFEETLDLLSQSLDQKHINVTCTFPPELPVLEADRDQVKQVVLNAIQNSAEALQENGKIRIESLEEVRDGFKGLLMTIHDNGKGINPEDLSKVFDPFFTTGKRGGTGLGLAICRNIIEAHGGSIRAESQVGVGTIMSIWLPLTLQEQPATMS
jgi:PAS domain S-box-containing protein